MSVDFDPEMMQRVYEEMNKRKLEIYDRYRSQGICPVCHGDGGYGQFSGGLSDNTPCPECNGTGLYVKVQK